MLELSKIKAYLDEAPIPLTVISKKTGIPYATVWRILKSHNPQPFYHIVERLSKYIESLQGRKD